MFVCVCVCVFVCAVLGVVGVGVVVLVVVVMVVLSAPAVVVGSKGCCAMGSLDLPRLVPPLRGGLSCCVPCTHGFIGGEARAPPLSAHVGAGRSS